MTIQLDKWNKELEALSNRRYKRMDGVLYNYYKDTLRQLKFEVQDYLEHYDELSFSKRLELENQFKRAGQIDGILSELSGKTTQTITEYVTEELQQGFYGTWYAIEGIENVQLEFGMLPERYIEQLVNEPVAGKAFSKRLYDNRKKLSTNVTTALLDGATRGVGYAQVAKRIGELTEANYKQALRIARTEGGRVQSKAKQKSYEDAESMGIKLEKQWQSTLDEKTRTSHQVLDGQRAKVGEQFKFEGYEADGPKLFGVTWLDINCRCTTIPVVNDIAPEFRVDNQTGEVIEYKNYSEWMEAKIDDETDVAFKLDGEGIMAKTNMLDMVGKENFEGFTNHLSNLSDERMAKLYETHGSDILYDQMKDGQAFASGKRITLSQSSFDGSSIKKPLETVYHENGHVIDRLGVKSITGEEKFKTGNKKKVKGYKGRMYEVDEEIAHASALPQYNLKQTIHDDLWHYVNGDLPTYDSLGKAPRKKLERERYDKKRSEVYTQNRANMEVFKENMLKLKESNPYSIGAISDMVESTGYLGEYPFDVGHGKNYWKQAEKVETEFFAHVSESIGANAEQLELMQEIFPNSMKTWETIVDDMIKGVE